MTAPVTTLPQLLRELEPELHEGVYAFVCLPPGTDAVGLDPIATLSEREGLTAVVAEATATEQQLTILFRAAWITLRVPSDLHAVGLTAAFASALARAGLSCNVLAGAWHDHVFVPVERANEAMATLRALQREAQATPTGGA